MRFAASCSVWDGSLGADVSWIAPGGLLELFLINLYRVVTDI